MPSQYGATCAKGMAVGHAMERILSVIKRESNIPCLACGQMRLDHQRFVEYGDADEHPAESPFERPSVPGEYRVAVPPIRPGIQSIFKYFLDGSRKTYRVADVIVGGRYLPLIAGQIGVAVVQRDHDKISVYRDFCRLENVLAFPRKLDDSDLQFLEGKIREHCGITFRVVPYTVKPDQDPVDLGTARILTQMHAMEVETVLSMAARGILANDRLLVVDGSLRFGQKIDPVQFRNVIGLSKTFRPSFKAGKTRTDVGSLASSLRFAERTSVFRFQGGNDNKIIGMWYLRMRRQSRDPLEGVVKVECYAVDAEDKENGLESDRVNVISAHILRERNVTPYGKDPRWASHIYPIYMAETFLKASFMSDTRFSALF